MSETERIISKRGKKIVKWGPGLAVLITKEARKIGWDSNTFLRVIVIVDEAGKTRIILEKMGSV